MSHFSVLVIGPDVEGQLAPYQENNMGDCPKEYLVFNDTTEEKEKEYAEGSTTCFVSPDGKPHQKYSSQFRQEMPRTKDDPFPQSEYVCPIGWEEKEVRFNELYPTFKKFVAAYHSEKPDKETGRYGYWENPNKKWDWYSIGGRWTGYMKLKDGAVGSHGEPGLMTPTPKVGTADVMTKGDIDWAFMRNEAEQKAANEYDMAMRIIGHLPANKSWAECRAEHPDNHESARKAFWAQERCEAWKAEEAKVGYKNWPFGFDSSPDDFLISRDRYIQNARNKAGTTFAVLKDGKWYERGKMGWWACVSEEKDAETWTSMFANLIDSLPDDAQLTVVDCHI